LLLLTLAAAAAAAASTPIALNQSLVALPLLSTATQSSASNAMHITVAAVATAAA
jgi:hypothetical protein